MKDITILIVDDQKEVLMMIASQLMLQNSSYKVINAISAEMAFRIAEEELPDLIIMDWDMPVINGIEATRRLKNMESTHDIPIIMSTGQMTNSEDLRIALEAGAIDYVRKPVDMVELAARISTALRIRNQNLSIQQLLKNEIQLKNRKLSTTSMLIVEKNTLLQEFQSEIDQIISLTEKDSKAESALKSLKKRVLHHIDLDSSWQTFKLHFDEVHPSFFTLLKKMSKDLSPKDLKLCAYIKLGIDNKQIAQLLNITNASTRTSLSRLKKKIGISEDTDLRKAISEIGLWQE